MGSAHKQFGWPAMKSTGMVLLFGLVAVLYLAGINSDIFFCFWPDQAAYLVYALAYSQGLGDRCLAVDPGIPTTIMHPPGFAYLLSLVIRGVGLHLAWMKFFLILIYLAGLVLYAEMMRRRDHPSLGRWAALLTATAPFALSFSQLVLADLPFIGLSLASLWACQRWELGGRRARWLIVSIVLGVMAFYFRAIGIALIGTLLAAMLLRAGKGSAGPGGRLRLALMAGLLLFGFCSWFVYDTVAYGRGAWQLFLHEMASKEVGVSNPGSTLAPLETIAYRFENLSTYVSVLGQFLVPWMREPKWAWLPGVLAGLLCAVGLISTLRKYRTGHEIYLLLYWPVLLVWAHPEQRYLLPLYPPLFYVLLQGLAVLGRLIHPRLSLLLPVLTAFAVLSAQLAIDLTQVITLQPTPWSQNRFRMRPMTSAPWLQELSPLPPISIGPHFRMVPSNQAGADLIRLELWAGDHLPQGSKVAVNFFNDCYLISGLRSFLLPNFRRDPIEVFTEYQVDYVFMAEAQPLYSNWVLPALKQHPDRFTEIIRVPGTQTALYRFQCPAPSRP
jgi:hypothetical protein